MKKIDKKVNLDNINQTNGATDYEMTTLDMIWGDSGESKYGTMDENDYSAQLRELNKSDLHAHAAKHGIMPIDNRERLTKTLIKEFKSYIGAFQRPKFVPPKVKPISKEVAKILAEGR